MQECNQRLRFYMAEEAQNTTGYKIGITEAEPSFSCEEHARSQQCNQLLSYIAKTWTTRGHKKNSFLYVKNLPMVIESLQRETRRLTTIIWDTLNDCLFLYSCQAHTRPKLSINSSNVWCAWTQIKQSTILLLEKR